MPRGDRTGPLGNGPRTGRGMGMCGGYDSPGFSRGMGQGRNARMGGFFRRGFAGRGGGFFAGRTVSDSEYKEMLRNEQAELKNRIEELEREINKKSDE